jgi:hypothetical protein
MTGIAPAINPVKAWLFLFILRDSDRKGIFRFGKTKFTGAEWLLLSAGQPTTGNFQGLRYSGVMRLFAAALLEKHFFSSSQIRSDSPVLAAIFAMCT